MSSHNAVYFSFLSTPAWSWYLYFFRTSVVYGRFHTRLTRLNARVRHILHCYVVGVRLLEKSNKFKWKGLCKKLFVTFRATPGFPNWKYRKLEINYSLKWHFGVYVVFIDARSLSLSSLWYSTFIKMKGHLFRGDCIAVNISFAM